MWSDEKKGKKMKIILIAISIFISTSCSITRLSRSHKDVHVDIKPYLDKAISVSKGRLKKEDFKNLTMGFKTYDGVNNVVGTCWPMPWLTEIDISKEWWTYNKSPLVRFELILHEVGHCVLNRAHTQKHHTSNSFTQWFENAMFKIGVLKEKDRLYDGCPSSIMHPYTLSKSCFITHYLYYIEELFSEISYEDFQKKSSFNLSVRKYCAKPKIINHTDKWTKKDIETLKLSKKRCFDIYKSCMKTFIKKEELTYNVICE